MPRPVQQPLVPALFLWLAVVSATPAADGLQSQGNTDGFLTWNLGGLAPNESQRRTALYLFERDRTAAAALLKSTRSYYRPGWSDAWASQTGTDGSRDGQDLWIKSPVTDFALSPDGSFFWESGQRQSLVGPANGKQPGREWTPPIPANPSRPGGQLSRVSFYLHYEAGETRHAGIRITGSPRLDGVTVARATTVVGDDRCATAVATADGLLQLEIRTAMGPGSVVAQEYVVTNHSTSRMNNLWLSVYANLEADHSHDNDYSVLDREMGALVTTDTASQSVCLLTGLELPDSGWSGQWPSQEQLAGGIGIARTDWGDSQPLGLVTLPRAGAGAEPETVALSREEAERVLEADWLLQAEGMPLVDAAAEEIAAARTLAARIAQRPAAPDQKARLIQALESDIAQLDRLMDSLPTLSSKQPGDGAKSEFYLAVRRVKRDIMFRDPLIDFDRVVFIDQPYPHGREWQHQARHRNGMMATPGGRLLVLEGLSPSGKLRKVTDLPPGSYWRPDLSFDGRRVLYCYQPADDGAFHLYESELDGTGSRQLTQGPFDDLDPIYLPDGGIAFVSTRTQTYVRCMPYTHVYTLCRMDGDGSNIRVLSHNNEPDWTPALLDDGRIIYSRWEYTDKALWRIQSLWTVRPDGTDHTAFYGNQSVWPDHLGEARQIPGTSKIMFTGLAHHNYFAGSLGVIDPARGANYPAGLTQITPEIEWPECGRGPNDDGLAMPGYRHRGRKGDYKSPYPLSEDLFLVSANTGPFNLYLMDTSGNKELIYRGEHNIWYGMPVRARPRPPTLPNHVMWPGADRTVQEPGILFSPDAYEGSGIPRGMVKSIRVLQAEYHTFTTWDRDFRFEGPSISVVQADNVKRILGIAPVEEDGSYHVEVPSGIAIHFQLLDEHQRALQTMRSFTGVMPGEVRGCVGCHENQGRSQTAYRDARALRRPPSKLVPPPWGDQTISFTRLVQPVLDKYCVRCHDGGGQNSPPDLRAQQGKGVASALQRDEIVFSEPYLYLIRSGLANVIQSEQYDQRDPQSYRTLPPLKHLSYRSRLLELATSGRHHGVSVDETSRLQLIGWIDANGPYRGMDDVRSLDDPRCQAPPLVLRP